MKIMLNKIVLHLKRVSNALPIGCQTRQLSTKLGITGVLNTIVISSAKGGVGKSSTTVGLALALKRLNPSLEIGILDADVFGPSIPQMMALEGQPEVTEQKLMKPLTNFGIKCISMGFLVDSKAPVVWRGLMVMSAINKLLFGVKWGSIDYLLIDMPPGTGDTQLSIAQSIPISGAIVVTTPQDIALLDARRGAQMFAKTNVRVLGIIQNMSSFVCGNCGHESHIFGHNGAQRLADELNLELLGDIPLDINLRECCDRGTPVLLTHPNSECSQSYLKIGKNIIQKMSQKSKENKNDLKN